MEIDVVLPCLNEAGALPWVLSRMPNGFRPIVADNGSTDESAAIAMAYGARVVPVPQRGFGAACHAGLLAASSDIVCVMDADASFDPGDLPLVAEPVATRMNAATSQASTSGEMFEEAACFARAIPTPLSIRTLLNPPPAPTTSIVLARGVRHCSVNPAI